MTAPLCCVEAGRVPYEDALALQRGLARARIRGDLEEDVLLLLEHEPVLTLGRGARPAHVPDAALLEARGIRRVEVERGGDVTYHGPGQLVGYPILDLDGHRRDLHWYVRTLEAAIIETIGRLGLDAFRVEGYTGVWTGDPPSVDGASDRTADGAARPESGDDAGPGGFERGVGAADAPGLIAAGRIRKVCSIGVHVSRWVTWHGFALNVTSEPLEAFRLIVPCGIDGVSMTSLESEGRGGGVEAPRLLSAVRDGFGRAFGTSVTDGPDLAALAEVAGLDAAGFGARESAA